MLLTVLGARGQIGTELVRLAPEVLGVEAVALDREQLDITRPGDLVQLRGDVVINTAAYHRVDACEDQRNLAFAVNATAVQALARTCARLGARLVHFSTDYVFGGDAARRTPYEEDDATAPLNAYGLSKVAGEGLLRDVLEDHLIVRTAGVFGARGSRSKGGNFVEAILGKLDSGQTPRVVTDQRSSPSFSRDVARAVLTLVREGARGTYHLTSSGDCTWHELATVIAELHRAKRPIERVTAAQLGARAKRPSYSVLRHARWLAEGRAELPHWRDGLATYLREREEER